MAAPLSRPAKARVGAPTENLHTTAAAECCRRRRPHAEARNLIPSGGRSWWAHLDFIRMKKTRSVPAFDGTTVRCNAQVLKSRGILLTTNKGRCG